MKGNRKKTVLTHQGAELKTRVARNRCRAQFVGIIYFIAIVLLAAIACLPLFDLGKQEYAPVGLSAVASALTPEALKAVNTWAGLVPVVNAALYIAMFAGVLLNVVRAAFKLKWLCKKKVSKTYGFNRNVYAMEDLGKIFSGSYAVMLIAYFLMAMLSGKAYPNLLMYLTFIGCAFIHLFAGFIGGKASYFNIEEGQITEDARVVGRFSALFRNVLQLVVVFSLMDYFQRTNLVHVAARLLEVDGINKYFASQPLGCVPAVMQYVGILCLIPLIKHATATTEFNIDGAYGAGMKTFRVFCFFLCGAIGLAIVGEYFIGGIVFSVVDGATIAKVVRYGNWGALNMFVVVFVMFIIEVLMRNMPGHKGCGCRREKGATESNASVVVYVN